VRSRSHFFVRRVRARIFRLPLRKIVALFDGKTFFVEFESFLPARFVRRFIEIARGERNDLRLNFKIFA
jgi:hypothetical protein